MKEFIYYFFSQGATEEFTNFSLAHFLPILLAVGLIYVIYLFRDKLRGYKREELIRYVMAFMLIISEMSYYWRLVGVTELGPNPVDHLPITVCGWVVVFASYMVIGKSETLFNVCYFWLFSGSIFALITPTVITYTGPTRFRYYQFWAEHLLGYVAVFYMVFIHGMRPTIKAGIKAYILLIVLAAVAYIANDMIGPGANYLFMAKPEDTPSILDVLPKIFALRLLIMVAAVTLLFALSYLPWYLRDRRAAKAAPEASK